MKMSCELVNTIGIGDCEFDKNRKSERVFATTIADEFVSEIIENALDIVDETARQEEASIGYILDNLSNKFKDMVLVEELPKSVDKRSISPKGGIGDQLKIDESMVEEETVRLPPVEKKNRLTDLVKNSKHILAKLIMTEAKENPVDDKEEKVVRVVDIDSGDPPFKVVPEHKHETVLREGGEENKMEDVQLGQSSETTPKESYDKKTMTFPMTTSTSSSGNTGSLASRYRTLKFTQELMKKRNWSFGTKILNYIRKHQKKGEKEKKTEDESELNASN